MKKTIYILILVIASIAYTSCNSPKESVSETFGKSIFEMLQQMDSINSDDFGSHFISLEELREFVKDTSITDNFRNAMTKVSKEKYEKGLLQAYEMMKESGEKQQIDWKNITYANYLYDVKVDNGVTFHDGYVFFDHDEKAYMTRVVSLTHQDKPRLFILSNFEPVTK